MDTNTEGLSTKHDGVANAPSTNSEEEGQAELKVTFWPPLYEQRRGWILDILRRENATTVLDIGCGEGTLLRCLCNPAAFLLRADDVNPGEISQHFQTSETPELHIKRLDGLDISESDLEACIASTTPHEERFSLPRWEPLDVKLWLGSLDKYIEEFVGVECIVSTEVIEHLPPNILPSFAPILLGTYRPRLFLVTTPNCTFNSRFAPPGESDREGFLDPTGRTDRVFRHHDHKFEWTVDEFQIWCQIEAERWSYSVEVGGVGIPIEADPWGRDKELGFATQTALFRRNDDIVLTTSPTHKSLPTGTPVTDEAPKLLASHNYVAHSRARKPKSLQDIQTAIVRSMEEYYYEEGWQIWDLWTIEVISEACGGFIDSLVDAVDLSEELSLMKVIGKPATVWRVTFTGEKHQKLVEGTRAKKHEWDEDSTKGASEEYQAFCNTWDRDEGSVDSKVVDTWPETDWPKTPHDLDVNEGVSADAGNSTHGWEQESSWNTVVSWAGCS